MRDPGFALFFILQNLPRGMLLSVIPLQAFAITGSAESASFLLFAVALGGIGAALVQPILIRQVGVYRAYLLSASAMILSSVLLMTGGVVFMALGLFVHAFAVAAAEVTLTLYVLARIPRHEISRFEPIRVLCVVLPLTIGPFAGVYLQETIAIHLPYVVTLITMVVAVVHFHWLGLHRLDVSNRARPGLNPLIAFPRFFNQPRLLLAYGLSLARSSWWTMFIIYTPIYAASTGLGELAGAALVSAGTAWTITVPFWGWLGRRYGFRFLVSMGCLVASIGTGLVFLLSGYPVFAVSLLVITAIGPTMLDGAGNLLFFRAVRAADRSEMSAIFSTYRDTGQILTPGVFAVLLKGFALPIVFASAAGWMLVAAWYSRYIPRSLR